MLSAPASAEAFIAALDEVNRPWRRTGASAVDIDEALDAAAASPAGRPARPWAHPLVVEAEATFPDAPSAAWSSPGSPRTAPANAAARSTNARPAHHATGDTVAPLAHRPGRQSPICRPDGPKGR